MLKSIHIRNFALAADLALEFGPGLNILTGETGAGKSVLVGAIAAVLGGRVYVEVVRSGFDKAQVDAVIDISNRNEIQELLQTKGLPTGEELFLRREISVKGSSRAFVNDSPVTIGTLAQIGNFLIDIHGQHEHQSLLRKETHRGILDEVGQYQQLIIDVANAFQVWKDKTAELKRLQKRKSELNSQYELNEFQYKEIEEAQLRPDEEEGLNDELKTLSNIEKLFTLCRQLNDLFSDEKTDLLGSIQEAEQKIKSLAEFSSEMKEISSEVSSARIVLEEAARSVEAYESNLSFDPQRLEEVQARLSAISGLKKKYGDSIEMILSHQKKLKESMNLRDNFDEEITVLHKQQGEAQRRYSAVAGELSRARKQTAQSLAEAVEKQLHQLGMPRMRFRANLDRIPDENGAFSENGHHFSGDENGIDLVEFFISPNPGEDFKPLPKIASGGEISRIMLAMKTILAGADKIPSLVFDEIDSGVSGRIAQSVGRSITALSRSHQIFCITHLPQIAAQGKRHYSVEKVVEGDRTFTKIQLLGESERVQAIASLIAGEQVGESVLASARELLAENADY